MSIAHFTEVLFIGFFTSAGLFSALVFLITRDRPFLWYAALMDTMAAAQLVFSPDLLGLSGPSLVLYRTLSFGAFFATEAGFAWTFLQLPARAPRYARAVAIVLSLNVLGLGMQVATGSHEPYRTIAHLLFIALLATCGAAAWACAGLEEARYYLAGFGGALLGAIASGVSQSLNLGSWPEYFFQFGLAWQGALVGLALASRYAKIDPLTGAKSRAAFEERLSVAWRSAQSQGKGLAVVMVAVGGLKEYDSQFGRIAGDALLRRIANSCVACCGDRLDLFARYGDEAFAAIVPRVSREQADAIGLRLREDVAQDCPLTVGVGVASNENAISAMALAQQAARRSARDAISRG
jgi:diguanylate cyclase (GGDEF)-like protein